MLYNKLKCNIDEETFRWSCQFNKVFRKFDLFHFSYWVQGEENENNSKRIGRNSRKEISIL